jgi:hypothetical protein
MNQRRLCACDPRRLIELPDPPRKWCSRAATYAQQPLDSCHLIHAWGNVDRVMSDLRQ